MQGIGAAALRATAPAAWPRTPGVLGDLRYVGTVLGGRRRARRILAQLSADDARARVERRQRLIAMARAAVGRDDLDVPAIDVAREQLAGLEDGRSRSAGARAAADAARALAEQQAAAEDAAATHRIAELERALAALLVETGPIEKAQSEAQGRATKLAEELAEVDRKIRDLDARAGSLKHSDEQRAAAAADRATARADREAIARDQPAIQARLDELAPVAAALLQKRSDLEASIARARQEQAAARARAASDVAALGARRDAAARASGDAEAARDEALLRLGNALALARPVELSADLAPLDRLAKAAEARGVLAAEQGDLLASVHKPALRRGVAYLATPLLLGAAAAVWLLWLR